MNQQERAIAQQWADKVQTLENENERLQAAYDSRGGEMDSMRMVLAETQKWNENRLAEIKQLRSLLGKLHWKSIDKDNMEFRCDTTCYVMDEIRAALEPKP